MSDKSLALVRAARAMAVSRGDPAGARAFLAAAYGVHNEGGAWIARQITDTASLQPGSAALKDLGSFLIGLVARRSVIGRLNQVSSFYRIPAGVPVLTETATATGNWSPEGETIKTSGQKFEAFTLHPLKIAALIVYTREFLRSVDPNVDTAVQRDIVNALARTVDAAFCDPTSAEIEGIKPASPFYGHVTEGSGDPAEALDTLLTDYPEDLLPDAVLVLNPADVPTLLAAGLARDGTLTVNDGGTVAGMLAVTAAAVPRSAIGIICPSAIAYSEAGANVEAATQALVQVEDNDTGETSLVSLWQQNLAALRGIQYVVWRVGLPGSARMVTGAIPATTANFVSKATE